MSIGQAARLLKERRNGEGPNRDGAELDPAWSGGRNGRMTAGKEASFFWTGQDTESPGVPRGETEPGAGTERGSGTIDRIRESLYAHLREFRSTEAAREIELGFSRTGYEGMIRGVFLPILVRIGRAWEEGRLGAAEEHYVTQFLVQRLYALFRQFPVLSGQPRTVALCPPGEHHQVGLLMFAFFLRQRGVDVLYLGPDTPYEGLPAIVERQSIRIVCLSLTDSAGLPGALDIVSRLLDSYPDMQFALGGTGFAGVPAEYRRWRLEGGAREWESWYERIVERRQQPC